MAENMIALERAQAIVLEHVCPTDVETVAAWRAVGLPLEPLPSQLPEWISNGSAGAG